MKRICWEDKLQLGEFMPGIRPGLGDKDWVDPASGSTTEEVTGRAIVNQNHRKLLINN